MTVLVPGANAALPQATLALTITHPGIPGSEIDTSAFLVGPSGKVRSDADMCFYGQPEAEAGCMRLQEAQPTRARFALDLARVPAGVERIILTATIHNNTATFGQMASIDIDAGGVRGTIPCAGKPETALLLGEIYRRQGEWKLRIIGQGFVGGLAALARHLGVDIADTPTPPPAPKPTPQPAPQPAPINMQRPTPQRAAAPSTPAPSLAKVNLTKASSSVSLRKDDGRFGKMRINLNWTQASPATGLSGMFGAKPVDLDLGCLVEDRYGNKTCVQALGNTFGDYQYFPYAKLLGDDRTGAVRDGEWLDVNGDMWREFNRLLIFAFIYKGAPNWAATDGTVRIHMPNQPEVEVRMNAHNTQEAMCAIAMVENDGGRMSLRREMRFFRGHVDMDEHYGWGLRWGAGRK